MEQGIAADAFLHRRNSNPRGADFRERAGRRRRLQGSKETTMKKLMILVLGLAAAAAVGCDDGYTPSSGYDAGYGYGTDGGRGGYGSRRSDFGGGAVDTYQWQGGGAVQTRDGTFYYGN
jgi:hypothetical protein